MKCFKGVPCPLSGFAGFGRSPRLSGLPSLQWPKRFPGLLLASLLALTLLVSCVGKDPGEWKSPVDDELLKKLADRTLEPGLSPRDRSRLLFLWGQELAQRSRQGGEKSALDRKLAIGAFLRVVDARAGLVDESRINLEILLRQDQQNKDQQNKDQQNKDQQNKDQQNKDQQGKDQQGKDQQGKDQQGKDQQGKDQKGKDQQGKDQQGKDQQGKDQQGKDQQGKDLSGLVRDKPGDSAVDKALKDEQERQVQARERIRQAGGITPVEKDW